VSQKVERHFVTLDGRWGTRQVHYRRAGSGPLLLLLHQSPQSSRELVPLMDMWSQQFTIVAPDSPGYGLSDPLGVDEAVLSDFADAIMEFMDAIGAGKFGIYGVHTGGMIGTAVADGYPERVTALACNGVLIPTDEELEELLAEYLPAFEPRWDGGHLAWLWGKTREQTIFFPWYNRTLEGRMDFSMPSPEHQQNSVLEMFRSGDQYRVAYRAAFVFHADVVIPRLQVPALFTAADWDPLQFHLARIYSCPDCVHIVESATPVEALERCLELLTANIGDELPAVPLPEPVVGRLWKQLVKTDVGELLVRRGGELTAPAVVIVHGAGGSSATVAALAESLADNFHVIAIDLPGHGESDCPIADGGPTVEVCAQAVGAVIDALGTAKLALLGIAGGALIALEFASTSHERVLQTVLFDVPDLTEAEQNAWRTHGLPSMAPDWWGGHLLRCWHMVRDGRLYFPWFQRDQDGIRWQEPEVDDDSIQLEVSEYLKAEGAWQALLGHQLDYPLHDKLSAPGASVICCATKSSPWRSKTERAAVNAGKTFQELPDDVDDMKAALSALLANGVQ